MKDYYAILGVDATAEESLIHAAYQVKTQLYQPDNFSGDPAEAISKLADINAAYIVLSNSTNRKEYDAERTENNLEGQSDKEIDVGSKAEIPGLPRIHAEHLSYPTFFFKPKINLSKAKTLFLESYKASATKPPNALEIKALVNSVACVYVPSWFISGSASGEWRAAGAIVDTQEVGCDKCEGKGTIAVEGYRQQCPVCHGSGQTDKHQNRKSTESGTAKASVDEYLPSTFAGIESSPDFSTLSKPTKATSQMMADVYCLQPEHNYEKAQELLSERLALALKNKALESLTHYDSVEGPHFGSTETYVFNKVELRLYPLYVCWYEKNAGKRFAICDGITGNVDIPQQKSSWGVFRSLLIMAAVGLVIYFSKGLFVGGDSLNPSATAKAPTQVVTATIMNKELLPAVKTPDKQNQQNHGVSQVIAAVKNVIHKPLKKTIPVNQGNPSFNCSEASFKAEKLICASKELADDDRKLAASYELKKQSTSFEIVKKQVILEQTNWIEHVRNACTDEACLVEAYHKRMGILSQPNQVKKTEVCPIPGHC